MVKRRDDKTKKDSKNKQVDRKNTIEHSSHRHPLVKESRHKTPSSKGREKEEVRKKKRKKEHHKKGREGKKIYSLLFNVLFYSFILSIIVGSLLFATSKDNDKTVFGYRVFGVLTDSMVPRNPKVQKGGFHSGDIIVVKSIDGKNAEVGDIVTFRPSIKSKSFLTHRVKKKMDHLNDTKGTYYITQGDANKVEDVPISSEQIVGKKILVIPKMGAILKFVKENPIVTIVFLLSFFGFIIIIKYYILDK